jgi:maltooligosyltrehalose trehalohydrolase
MVTNAGYWIDEFHLDGLRFDATHQLFDASAEHLLAEISLHARAAAHGRPIILVAENEAQDARMIRPRDCGGYGLDGMWNEDFHHSVMVALTGSREAYYSDYRGTPQELVSLARHGFLYQGQQYSWQGGARGTPAYGLDPSQFVTFLQNHDQIANGPSELGERLHQLASPGAYRALTAFWLLSPGTPMFFQGQEFAASSPFLYFADHSGALGAAVRSGRAEFMRQFRSIAGRDPFATLPDPADVATFERCRLRDDERMRHQQFLALHRDLLSLRRSEDAFHWERAKWADGAVLGDRALLLRFFVADPRVPRRIGGFDDDRLVIVNLGDDLDLESAPEPLLAPPAGAKWQLRWSSEGPAYGGGGTAALGSDRALRIQGETTIVLAAEPA